MLNTIFFYNDNNQRFTKINRNAHVSVVIDGKVDIDKSEYNYGTLFVESINKEKIKAKIISGIENGTYIIKNGYILLEDTEKCFSKNIRTIIIKTDDKSLEKGYQAIIELERE